MFLQFQEWSGLGSQSWIAVLGIYFALKVLASSELGFYMDDSPVLFCKHGLVDNPEFFKFEPRLLSSLPPS